MKIEELIDLVWQSRRLMRMHLVDYEKGSLWPNAIKFNHQCIAQTCNNKKSVDVSLKSDWARRIEVRIITLRKFRRLTIHDAFEKPWLTNSFAPAILHRELSSCAINCACLYP